MVKLCDTCGRVMDEAHPFRFCPNCLFGEEDNGDAPSGIVSERVDPPALAAAARLYARPDFFKKYDILEKIDGGGQGEVWKVWDFEFRRIVAMKRLAGKALSSESAIHRFLAEAQIAGQLEHPGILPVFDVGLDPDGRPFYTTQLLPPRTLEDVCRQSRHPGSEGWTTARVLGLLQRICEVMAYAHGRGVIHRDLKPANILVGPFGDVRVIDWGSAHVLDTARKTFEEAFVSLDSSPVRTDRQESIINDPHSSHSTARSGLPITVLFMPPEILRGQTDQIGPETDVYSLGVMLYELLTGHAPYARQDGSLPPPAELRERILGGPPVTVRTLNRSASRDLSAICHKAMAHSKSDRYPTMGDLAADLRAVFEVRPVQARNPGSLLRLQKWAQRRIAQLLPGGAILLVASIAYFLVRGSLAERDVARQLAALEQAERAGHSGQWRAALRHWQEAETAGFSDAIRLGLRRAEAWTVLGSARRARVELDKLANRSDLAGRRGAVLLRLGEHEMFDRSTYQSGVDRVREGMAAGLTAADQSFARGLLADSTPQALEAFRRALQFDPYHHGAHRHSLGLEYLLGRHEELETHSLIFKVLFPDDPSPGFLQAAELAARQRLPEAEAVLKSLRDSMVPELRQRLKAGFAVLAATAKHFDVQAHLPGPRDTQTLREQLAEHLESLPLGQGPSADVNKDSVARLPRLPCLQQYLEGTEALKALLLPGFTDAQPAIQKARAGWQRHPEAWLPALAGSFLENWQPREGPKSAELLVSQAELFQMAAESGSVIPTVPRWSRHQAASRQFELARSAHTNAAVARRDCLANARRIAETADASAPECEAYFEMTFALGDHQLARALLNQWERQPPADPRVFRRRIELEIAAGGFGEALRLLDKTLSEQPGDDWARQQRQAVVSKLEELIRAQSKPGNFNPSTLNLKVPP